MHYEFITADAEGLKKLIMSIRNSINQFRESENVSQAQANELYNQVFTVCLFLIKFLKSNTSNQVSKIKLRLYKNLK